MADAAVAAADLKMREWTGEPGPVRVGSEVTRRKASGLSFGQSMTAGLYGLWVSSNIRQKASLCSLLPARSGGSTRRRLPADVASRAPEISLTGNLLPLSRAPV